MTKFEKICAIFLLVVGIILAAGFGFKIVEKRGYRKGFEDALKNAKPDTVMVVDTITYEKPVEKIKWRDKIVYVPVTDSVIIHKNDTTYIALPFEKVAYKDSTYSAIVSGYQPALDWIEVYQKTAYITNVVVEKKRWSFSVTAGAGVIWDFIDKKVHGGPGLMGGVSYNF